MFKRDSRVGRGPNVKMSYPYTYVSRPVFFKKIIVAGSFYDAMDERSWLFYFLNYGQKL